MSSNPSSIGDLLSRFELSARPTNVTPARRTCRARSMPSSPYQGQDLVDALVAFGEARANDAASSRAGVGRPSSAPGLLVRAQARSSAYAELLEPLLEAVMGGATPSELDSTVRALCDTLLETKDLRD